MEKQSIIARARYYWDNNEDIMAGKTIYERISLHARPIWAAEILEIAYGLISDIPEVNAAISFARTEDEWTASRANTREIAHEIFQNIRRIIIVRSAHIDSMVKSVLFLSENVVKMTYNCYGYIAPYDHDAAWWIAPNIKTIVNKCNDQVFSHNIWNAFAREDYITLEKPIQCNKYCDFCWSWKTFDEINILPI